MGRSSARMLLMWPARARRRRRRLPRISGLSVSGELKVSYAWSALGRHTVALQRKREELHPGVRLIWVQSNAPTGGLANGSVDVTIVRRTLNDNRFGSTLIGTEARYGPPSPRLIRFPAAIPPPGRFLGRTIAVDHRTGTTTEGLWSGPARPASVRLVHGVGEWHAHLYRAGHRHILRGHSCAESTAGIAYRPVRDAPPISVFLAPGKTIHRYSSRTLSGMAPGAFGPDHPAL